MKMLKNVGIALGIILVIAAVIVYFLPKEYKFSNSITIDRPVEVVYAQVADFKTWGKWDPWAEKDTNTKATVEGTAGAKGEKMSWESKVVGQGSMTIGWTTANKAIRTNDTIVKPYPGISADVWEFEADGNKTKVTWTSSGGLPYPFARIFGLTFPKEICADEAHGLDNLKKFIEAIPAPQADAASDTTATTKSM